MMVGGAKAAMRLIPTAGAGAPTTPNHDIGEVVLDSRGNLYLCVQGDASTAGEWAHVGYTPIDPVRIYDSRAGSPPDLPGEHTLAPGDEIDVPIVGSDAPVPSAATAIVINVTAVNPTAAGYLSVYPANLHFTSASPPSFSNVNFGPGVTTANQATIKIPPTGSAGAGTIRVFNLAGQTDVVIDAAGYFV
jgi:hypothetical protein